MNAKLTGIDHIGAPTWDAATAAEFYTSLGIPIVHEETMEEHAISAVFLDFGGIYLEFLEPTGPGPVKTFLERHGPGYQHIAYRVHDIQTVITELRDRGVRFQTEDSLQGVGGAEIIFVEETDTTGFQTELVEREEPL